jgi:hypothetical protein
MCGAELRELEQRHVSADLAFGEVLLREGIDTMLAGADRYEFRVEDPRARG